MDLARIFLYAGFFVSDDTNDTEAQLLFVCERKAFIDLCTGLSQPCQCQANTWKLTKTVQVDCPIDTSIQFMIILSVLQKGHVLRVEFQCQCCKRRQWWASSRTLGGRYLINQKCVVTLVCFKMLVTVSNLQTCTCIHLCWYSPEPVHPFHHSCQLGHIRGMVPQIGYVVCILLWTDY